MWRLGPKAWGVRECCYLRRRGRPHGRPAGCLGCCRHQPPQPTTHPELPSTWEERIFASEISAGELTKLVQPDEGDSSGNGIGLLAPCHRTVAPGPGYVGVGSEALDPHGRSMLQQCTGDSQHRILTRFELRSNELERYGVIELLQVPQGYKDLEVARRQLVYDDLPVLHGVETGRSRAGSVVLASDGSVESPFFRGFDLVFGAP